MNLWMEDPKTPGTKSVSLTLMVISFVAVLIAIGLNMANITQNTGPVTELFYSCAALYLGRKINFKGQNYSSDQAEQVVDKLEQK